MKGAPPVLAELIMEIPHLKRCVQTLLLQDIDEQCKRLCENKRGSICVTHIKRRPKEFVIIFMDEDIE